MRTQGDGVTRYDHIPAEITPSVLLKAYACGIFPMAESARDEQLYWIEPQHRGVLPLDRFHIPSRLARTIRQDRFEVRIDHGFDRIIEACAASRPGRRGTWINSQIISLYRRLYEMGHCHTIECWHGGRLAGGLYGVHLGAAFFGESMVSFERDASKVALVHLVGRLIRGGFKLLDTQFITEHLRQFGTVEIERTEFQKLLEPAVRGQADFSALAPATSGAEILAIIAAAQSAPA